MSVEKTLGDGMMEKPCLGLRKRGLGVSGLLLSRAMHLDLYVSSSMD
jgi:hypothetical protein